MRVVEAATDEQPVSSVDGASLHPGQERPVEEPVTLGAQAHREALPVASMHLVGDAAHIAEQGSVTRLHADHLDRGNSQCVGRALRFEKRAQLRAMPVDAISHHPAAGHASRQGARQHVLGQFGFGLKKHGLRDVGGLPTCRINAPVFGQV